MRNYMVRARLLFGGCVVAGLLSGPSCAAGGEDVGQLQQALLCQSVDVCDDANPCTDDLCVVNLCVNTPLLNCAGGGGGGGGEGGEGGSNTMAQGGKSGAIGGSAGTKPVVTEGGMAGERAGGGPDVGGTSSGGEGAIDSGGTSQAGHSMVSSGATAGAAGDAYDQDGTTAWRMQGGGCTLAEGAARPGAATKAWALLGALILGASRLRRRQQRPRTHGEPDS